MDLVKKVEQVVIKMLSGWSPRRIEEWDSLLMAWSLMRAAPVAVCGSGKCGEGCLPKPGSEVGRKERCWLGWEVRDCFVFKDRRAVTYIMLIVKN